MGPGDGAVVALNGMPINGSNGETPDSPRDWLQEKAPLWPPASGSWPDSAFDELDVERSRLEAEIATAKARAAAARRRDTQMRAAMHADVVVSQQRLAEMEREHDTTIATIREAAQAEVARILSEARREVAGRSEGATPSEPAWENHAE